MQKVLKALLVAGLTLTGLHANSQTQIIDVSTGIDASGNLIPIGLPDDTWTVALPSSPALFQSATCISPDPAWSGATNARWIFPTVLTGSPSNSGPAGYYYYRMTFTVDCEVSSAQLNLGEICADDVIDAISVNGMMITSGNYSYGGATYGPCGTGVTIPLTGSIFPGLNELVVRVKNEPFYGIGTVTGLKIKGNLSIIAAGADPSFYMINNGANVQAIPASIPGTHTWAVYASSTGNPGTYSYVGTYNTTYLNFQAQYACYLIRHTVSGESCTACRSQSICNLPCTNICNLSVPQNLQSTSTSPSSLLLSWDPVANASSYVLEIAWNDPACCNNSSQLSFIQTIPVTSNSYSITSQTSTCFSWKVKALCGEESTVSEKKCAHFSGGIRFRTGSTQPDNKIPTLEIFPNPTKDVVSFIVETGRDMEFSISITDIGGRTIMSFDPVTTEGRRGIVEWNTSSLSKGIYIVKVTTGDNLVLTKKLVID